jgi:hypothetical protein
MAGQSPSLAALSLVRLSSTRTDLAVATPRGLAIRNPLVVVGGYAEVRPAIDWVRRIQADAPPRVTFVHVIDTRLFFRGAEWGLTCAAGAIVDAERDGQRLLEMLRAGAPEPVSVTTRLLKAPTSSRDQLLQASAEVPCCDAIVVCTPISRIRLVGTARMVRRLRLRSSIPVVALEELSGAAIQSPLVVDERRAQRDHSTGRG